MYQLKLNNALLKWYNFICMDLNYTYLKYKKKLSFVINTSALLTNTAKHRVFYFSPWRSWCWSAENIARLSQIIQTYYCLRSDCMTTDSAHERQLSPYIHIWTFFFRSFGNPHLHYWLRHIKCHWIMRTFHMAVVNIFSKVFIPCLDTLKMELVLKHSF